MMRRTRLAIVLILALAAGHAATSARHPTAIPPSKLPARDTRSTPWTGVQVPTLGPVHTLTHRDGELRVLRQGNNKPGRSTEDLHEVR
jgi:hypothetical protein